VENQLLIFAIPNILSAGTDNPFQETVRKLC
jgi:hypothetical protein